uniref:Uncharacterized protein n=1 Tax=Salarias fasciatus TaxID=181472 RepID=A0A672I175_SALFA
RPLLQPGRCLHLVHSLRQVVQSLEEVEDQDYSWRAELMMQVTLHTIFCLPSAIMHRAVNCINYVLSGICRVAFLLELALLALQVKHQKVAADCLKELKSVGEAVMLWCRCYRRHSQSAAVVPQARLKEVGRLDQWLQTALREGPPQAVQAVCATQWALCLPLLQHNLRKRVKQPLLRLAGALENMQSMFLEMRCHVHLELAVIEEEEGRLEASSTHLRKALLLDNGALRERLSSALRVSELRQTVYQTPSRVEDQALMLMQQIKEMQPEDRANSRPMLVAAGLLLAPDDFQMVLDADDTSPVAGLAAQAQRHSTCVQKADGHLARPGADADDTERVNLWATLSKTARKLEVWDVCRAACRFCLLYDDGRWKISKSDSKRMNDSQVDNKRKCSCSEGESCTECLPSCSGTRNCVNMLRLLAEIHFISAEVCSYSFSFYVQLESLQTLDKI